MRALFDYDPSTDALLPCQDIGLPFSRGDILQVRLGNFIKLPNSNKKLLISDHKH